MFKKTPHHIPMFTADLALPDSARRRLAQTWATGFAAEVLPVLLDLEPRFAHLYADANGRPNWSIARRVGLCILQEMLSLSDQAVVDSLAFDVRLQVALGLQADEAYLSRRSLVDFRSRLVAQDPEMKLLGEVFRAVGSEAMTRLGIAATEQRIDATLVTSNIMTRGRADLFGKTLGHFADWLSAHAPDRFERLEPALRAWLGRDRQGWLGHPSRAALQATLRERATWAVHVVQTFAGDAKVTEAEPWQLVARLVREHCEVQEAAGQDSKGPETTPENVKLRAAPLADSMQSPFDPDAGHGHKGTGYHVHVTETCRNEGIEIITDIAIVPAQTADRAMVAPVLARLAERGCEPQTLYADGGYASGGTILRSAAVGVELVTPVNAGPLREGHVGRESFVFNDQAHVVACPQGHAPERHATRHSDTTFRPELHAFFPRSKCTSCPLHGRCASRSPGTGKGAYHLEIRESLVERDRALARQQQAQWWPRYAIRAGCESTMSELKRRHGLGRLRVRRLPRVRLAVTLKATACNVKRWMKGHRRAA